MFRPPILTLTLALVAAGCALPTDGGRATGWLRGGSNPAGSVRRASAEDPVVQVAAFWQAAEGLGPAGTPVRGFAGRILLTTASGPEPVAANGAVRLYLFSDDGDRGERAAPVNQIDLTPEMWSTCGAMSSLGPGYEVFVPYPKRTDHAVRCSLRVRFTPVGEDGAVGRPLFSPAVGCTLDGPPDPAGDEFRQRHTLVTETLRPPEIVPVRLDRGFGGGAPAGERGVVPASASAPAGPRPDSEVPGAAGLSAAGRARVEAALAAYRRRAGAGGAKPDFSRTRSRFMNADAVAAVLRDDAGENTSEDAGDGGDGLRSRRRFGLTPPPGRPAAREGAAAPDRPTPPDRAADPFPDGAE